MDNTNKRSLAYISADFFIDVDMPILPTLAKHWDVTWYVYTFDSARYSVNFLTVFASNNNIKIKIIHLTKRKRSLKNIICIYNLYINIKIKSFSLHYFEYIHDPYTILLSLIISRKKKILALHDVESHSNFVSKSFILSKILAIRMFSFVQTFSISQSNILKEKYRKNSFVIPLSKKDSGKPTLNRPLIEDGIKFLFFGSIHQYKRLDILIQAFEKLLSINDKAILTIAGKGPHWMYCSQYIKTPQKYNLRINFIEQTEVANLLMEHHFLVLPYQDVTQPGPLFDAFNYNLPVITSDLMGFEEFVRENVVGFTFKTGNFSHLAEVMNNCCCITNTQYNSLLEELNKYTLAFDKNEVALKYLQMFNSFI